MRIRKQIAEEMLVLAAQAGQAEAFAQLAARWQAGLLRQAGWRTGDHEGAAEVVQDAWAAIVRGLPRLRDPACFSAWARRIVDRRAAEWVRRRQRSRLRSAELADAAEVEAPAGALEAKILRLRAAIARLDSEIRLMLAMFYVERMTVAEIGQALGIPAGTVKSRLYHARERLRAILEVGDVEKNES